jgi:hypothetical protein
MSALSKCGDGAQVFPVRSMRILSLLLILALFVDAERLKLDYTHDTQKDLCTTMS